MYIYIYREREIRIYTHTCAYIIHHTNYIITIIIGGRNEEGRVPSIARLITVVGIIMIIIIMIIIVLILREFRDAVFEDVVFDNNSCVTIYYGKTYYSLL